LTERPGNFWSVAIHALSAFDGRIGH
jgi:hypothetical protein